MCQINMQEKDSEIVNICVTDLNASSVQLNEYILYDTFGLISLAHVQVKLNSHMTSMFLCSGHLASPCGKLPHKAWRHTQEFRTMRFMTTFSMGTDWSSQLAAWMSCEYFLLCAKYELKYCLMEGHLAVGSYTVIEPNLYIPQSSFAGNGLSVDVYNSCDLVFILQSPENVSFFFCHSLVCAECWT